MSGSQRSSKDTRRALVDAARRLFVANGYFNTGTEELVTEAGVGTRGALYHHFESKRALFTAVFVEVLEDQASRPLMPAEDEAEPMDRLRTGLKNFLRSATDPEVQRIILIDGPTVLGWDTMRALQEPTVVATLRDLLRDAMAADAMRRQPLDPLARLLIGAVQEAGLLMARADAEESRQIEDALDQLVVGWAVR